MLAVYEHPMRNVDFLIQSITKWDTTVGNGGMDHHSHSRRSRFLEYDPPTPFSHSLLHTSAMKDPLKTLTQKALTRLGVFKNQGPFEEVPTRRTTAFCVQYWGSRVVRNYKP